MRAIVIQSPWNAAAVEREIPRPREGEALLKMTYGGICGSDLTSYRGMSVYISCPRTIGHEFVAEVVEVGDNVYGIKSDMIVTGNPYFNCGTHYSCHRDMMNCCVRNETMDAQREDAFSDYLTMSVGRLYDGQDIDSEELALIKPSCISCHGVLRTSVRPGDRVLVFGAGAIGILTGVATESSGARVYVTDIAGEKMEAAIQDFHLSGGFVNESRERLDAFVQEITDGDGFDVTMEAVGAPSIFLGCVQAVASKGRVVVIGMVKHSAGFNFLELQREELEMYGSRAATAADFAVAMRLVKGRFVDLKKLISRTYPAGSTAEALRDLDQNYGEIIKAELEF